MLMLREQFMKTPNDTRIK